MNERMIFIAAWLSGLAPFNQLCARAGISRKTGYKWLHRYQADGAAGLNELGSARHTQSHAIAPEIAEQLIALRRRRPTWGPRKLLARLAMDDGATDWPAASTVGDLLRRHDLSQARPRRAAVTGRKPALTPPSAPNESWAIDFKGWFRTGDGVRCEPLTITDSFSRYLMVCQAVPQITAAQVQPIMVRAFQAHGLPRALRSDNGSPFASSRGLAGLTQLSVWLLTLNIWPDRIDPGRPDQNGRHERMHRVLHEDAADPPAATIAAQQARLDTWRLEYNTVRPHEALGQRCPASLFIPSPRAYPARVAAWDYPADHHAKRVSGKGYITWRGQPVYLTEALAGQSVALAQLDDGDWAVRFRQFSLAVITDQTNQIRPSRLARTAAAAPWLLPPDPIQHDPPGGRPQGRCAPRQRAVADGHP
jgi:transposase InsO family protein